MAIKSKTGNIPTQSAKGAAATFAANVVLGSVKALVSDSDVTANDVDGHCGEQRRSSTRPAR